MTNHLSIACLSVLLSSSVAAAAPPPTASRKMVAIIDSSGSFKSRQGEAVERLQGMLDQISAEKIHRWDEDTDRISIIALDAMPQVVWSGGQRELANLAPTDWQSWFAARADYDGCTDVAAAFRKALPLLRADNEYTDRYLFLFSDLVDEPPIATNVRRCRRAVFPSPPPAGVAWEELAGVQIVGYWLPPNQVLAWLGALEETGVQGAQLFSISQSASTPVFAPPRATVEYTQDELEQQQDNLVAGLGEVGRTIGRGALALLALCLGFGGIALLAARRLNRRRAAARRVPAGLAGTQRPRPGPTGGLRPAARPAPGHGSGQNPANGASRPEPRRHPASPHDPGRHRR